MCVCVCVSRCVYVCVGGAIKFVPGHLPHFLVVEGVSLFLM